MGTLRSHPPVKYFTAVTFYLSFNPETLFSDLENKFSTIEMKSNPFEFSAYTSYYQEEMGEPLKKIFIAFSELMKPENLPAVKIFTNKAEKKFTVNKKRLVNIDPGYICPAKLVLATTKNYSHRIYLNKNIYGDIHLQFSNGTFQSQPWTYPDYQNKENIRFFNAIRKRYLEQLGDVIY